MALIERLVVGLLAFLISACAATHLAAARAAAAACRRDPGRGTVRLLAAGPLRGYRLDFARRLAHELGRPLEIVPVAWDEQIPTLLAGRTDVIMSGMSITPKRAARVAFGAPYLTTSLQGVVRSEDAERWPTPEALLQTSPRIGVKAGTTGEEFVRQRRPNENIVVYRRSRDAITELIAYRIDVYVGDAPVIAEAVAMNTGKLVAYPRDVGKQSLAWAFHPEDEDLRRFANALLERWRADGTLRQVLDTWSKRPK